MGHFKHWLRRENLPSKGSVQNLIKSKPGIFEQHFKGATQSPSVSQSSATVGWKNAAGQKPSLSDAAKTQMLKHNLL